MGCELSTHWQHHLARAMRTIATDEVDELIPRLREMLEIEYELVLTADGEPVVRLLPTETAPELQSLLHS